MCNALYCVRLNCREEINGPLLVFTENDASTVQFQLTVDFGFWVFIRWRSVRFGANREKTIKTDKKRTASHRNAT